MKPALAFLLLLAGHTLAAPITWGPSRDITADGDVSTRGTLVKAVCKTGNLHPVVNGVTFTPYGNDTLSGANASNSPAIGALPVGGGISQAYATLLAGNDYHTSSGSTVTLTIQGLTVGHHYEVQVWANDSDASGGTQTIKSGGALDPAALLIMNTTANAGGRGQFVTGTFTADATSQAISFKGSGNGMVQAYQVRRITDPLAPVVWERWQETTGDADVNTAGTSVKAYVFGSATPSAPIQGVTFARFANQTTDTLDGMTSTASAFGSASAPYANLSADYKTLLGHASYSSTKYGSLTLNGLTPGQWYVLQVWVNDSRAATGGRWTRINGSTFLSHNPGGPSDNLAYEGGLGHHMIGTFRAGAPAQRLDFGASASAQINGLQLRSIPAPNPLVMEAKQRNQHALTGYIDGRITSSSRFDGVHLAFGSGDFPRGRGEMSSSTAWLVNNGYTFDLWPALDATIRWKKYVDAASRAIVKTKLKVVNYTTPGTSNLVKLSQTIRFLGSEEFGEEAFDHPADDWRPSDPNGRNWLIDKLRQESMTGLSEFASNDYGNLNSLPSLSLGQLARDPEMRAAGVTSFTAFMAQLAAVWQPQEYYAGVWSSRSYEDQSGYYGTFGRELYQALGAGGRTGDAKAMALMAVSGFTLPAPILHAANDRTTSYNVRHRGDGYQQAFVNANNYVLFGSTDGRAAGSGWCWGYGVRWRGMSNFFWLMGVATDDPADMRAASNHGKMQLDFDILLHRDSMLYAFDKSHPLARDPRYALAHVPGGYQAMINDAATSGRIFLHYGTVMISVASDVLFNWDPNSGIHSPRNTPQPGDSEFRIAVGGVGYPQNDPNFAANISATNNRFAVAIETALPSEFAGANAAAQLAAFKSTLLANTNISHTDVTVGSYKITRGRYVNRHGDILEKESYNDDRTLRGGWINGVAVDYANWPKQENPWMSTTPTGDVLTVTSGNQRSVLNYNQRPTPMAIAQSTVPPAAATPEVKTLTPAGIAETSATLVGELTSTGTSSTSVTAYWGPTDGGTTAGNWANNIPLGPQVLGQVIAPISGLTANTTYRVRFAATNASGTVWSPATVTFTTAQIPPPPRPDGLATTPTLGFVPLTWNAVPGATGYRVKRSTTTGGPYSTLAANVTATSYADTTALAGTPYYYVISALGTGGESGNSGEVAGTPAVPPAAPAGLTVTQGYIYPELAWNAVPFATTYTVLRSTTLGGPYSLIASGLASTQYSDNSALNNVTYFWVVTAENVAGTSAASNEVSLTTNVASFINVTAGNWNAVTWIPSPPGQPAPSSTAIIDFQNTAPIASNQNMGSFALNQLRFFNQSVTLSGSALNFSGTAPTIISGVPNLPHSIANPITLTSDTTFDVSANTLSANGVISGTKNLIKAGSGTLSLGAANTYTGNTLVTGGLLRYSANNTGVKTLLFGSAVGATGTGTLDLAANVTALALTTQTGPTAGSSGLVIGSGKTLTVNGALTLGGLNNSAASNSHLTATGAGSLVLNFGTNASIRRGSILDLSKLGALSVSGTNLNIGDIDNYTVTNPSELIIPADGNTTIHVANLNLDSATAGGGTSRGESATFTAPSGTGTLVIRGSSGGSSPSNLYLGKHAGSGSAGSTMVFDTRGHYADIILTNLEISRRSGTHSGGTGNASFHFDAGTLSVANTVLVGIAEGAAHNTGALLLDGGTITFSGGITLGSNSSATTQRFAKGSVTLDGSAAVTSGRITLANLTGTATGRQANASLTVNGGSLTMTDAIVKGDVTGTGTVSASLILDGGELDMQGHAIGSATNPLPTVTFNSGTLRNIASINGGANLVKESFGTLTLDGLNTHASDTVVNAGTLELAPAAGMRFLVGPATSNKLTGSGAALLAGAFHLDLATAAPAAGKTWTLADVATATYEPTFSVTSDRGDFIGVNGVWTLVDGGNLWTYTTATGLLTVELTDDVWTGALGSGTWASDGNWSSAPFPGSGGTARFRGAGGPVDGIDLGSGVTISSLLFETPFVAAYTIGAGAVGSQTLTLNDGGSIQAGNTIGQNQVINSALVLGTDGSAQSYSLINSATSNSLEFAGGIRGGSGGTAGAKTLNVPTPGPITISGPISNGGASSLVLTKTGTGTLTLSGTNMQTGAINVQGTLSITGSGSIAPATGATLTLGGSAVGTLNYHSSALSRFGSILVGNGNDGAGNCALNQSAGTINATALTLNNGFTGAGAGDVNLSGGLLAVSGAATISNQVAGDNVWSTLTIGTNATLTVGNGLRLTGAPAASRNAAGRVIQNGGIVTVANGLTLARTTSGNSSARRGEYHLNVGTLNVNQINQDAGSDTIGTFNFNGGTLKPTASTTSFFQGITRANLRDGGAIIDTGVFSITLAQNLIHSDLPGDAPLDGGLRKSGLGKLTLAGTNTYTGATTVNEGTLEVTGSLGATAVEVKTNATLSGTGTLGGNVTIRTGGRQAFGVAASAAAQTARTITGSLTLEANTVIDLTAAAPPALGGPYVLLTATGGITGSVGSVTLSGLSGTVVKNGNNLELTVTAPSGFASWIATPAFGLAVADQDPTDDPDHDGLENLLEFVLNGNPSVSDPSILPRLNLTATNFEFTYQRRDDSVAPEIIQTFQWGGTLATWPGGAVIPATSNMVGAATVTVSAGTPDNAATDTVKVSIPKAEAGGAARLFGRLQVTKP
jgi:autotransporter-associated beta strand protein